MREHDLLSLTAADLMTREVKTVRTDMPLPAAARMLSSWRVRGAPVVDEAGRCVGVLSVSDLARWAADRGEEHTPLPRTCNYWERHQEPGGEQMFLCHLAEGSCPFQHPRELADGTPVIGCTDPHCVPTDWQIVELESVTAAVRDVMTTEVVGVGPDAPVPELARVMLDRGVHRLLVLDPDRHPVGVLAVNDLLQVLAHPDLVTGGVR